MTTNFVAWQESFAPFGLVDQYNAPHTIRALAYARGQVNLSMPEGRAFCGNDAALYVAITTMLNR